MRKIFIISFIMVLAVSCAKEETVPEGKVIAETTVESGAGSIDVLITTTGIWSARSLSVWIDVDESWHRDTYVIVLNYSSNRSMEGRICNDRTGKVAIRSFDGRQCDTIVINQRGMPL